MASSITTSNQDNRSAAASSRGLEGTSEIAFARMVQALTMLNVAERDVSGLSAFDPAFDTWFREAEAARAAVLAAADAVIMAGAPTATDRRFIAVTRNFESMMLTDDPVRYAGTAQAMLQMDWLYHVPGRGPRTARANVLLQTFRHHFGILMGLPDYAPTATLVQNDDLALAA